MRQGLHATEAALSFAVDPNSNFAVIAVAVAPASSKNARALPSLLPLLCILKSGNVFDPKPGELLRVVLVLLWMLEVIIDLNDIVERAHGGQTLPV